MTATLTPSEAVSEAVPQVVLEVLYLDQDTCEPCHRTTDAAESAAAALSEHLREQGRTLEVRTIHVTDVEQARALGFVSSPTVRVDGVDIELAVREQSCATCGHLAGEPIACRTFLWQGVPYSSPPAEMITYRVLEHLAGVLPRPPSPAPGDISDGISGEGRDGATSVERFLAARIRWATRAAALRRRIRGTVVAAGDPGYAPARATFNTLDTQRPALVAVPVDASDVVAVVDFAREHGLRIVPQRTGHNASPLGDIAGAILLRTDAMREVVIDPMSRTARVQSGAKWEDVVPRASELGLAALHGSTPDVSIAGYATGGGLGWYGRKHGLAANSIVAIELVTADGRLRRVDARHEPELFWALRGGGGANFGVITALEVQLFPVTELYAGVLFFPWERSTEVLHAWHEWTASVPEETTSVGRIMQFPAAPDVPEPMRGRAFVLVEVFHLGGEPDGARLVEPLRRLGPEIDTVALTTPVGLAQMHMDPVDPLPYRADHLVLGELTPAAIDTLVDAVGPGSGSELVSVEIRHLGGALGRAAAGHGALARIPGSYLVFGIGVTPDDPAERAVRARLDSMVAAMQPLASGLYFNFVEHAIDTTQLFDAATLHRLQRIRGQVDPDGLFRANHPLPGQRAK
jgi:FAD/FMN-containing dehydrogenase